MPTGARCGLSAYRRLVPGGLTFSLGLVRANRQYATRDAGVTFRARDGGSRSCALPRGRLTSRGRREPVRPSPRRAPTRTHIGARCEGAVDHASLFLDTSVSRRCGGRAPARLRSQAEAATRSSSRRDLATGSGSVSSVAPLHSPRDHHARASLRDRLEQDGPGSHSVRDRGSPCLRQMSFPPHPVRAWRPPPEAARTLRPPTPSLSYELAPIVPILKHLCAWTPFKSPSALRTARLFMRARTRPCPPRDSNTTKRS